MSAQLVLTVFVQSFDSAQVESTLNHKASPQKQSTPEEHINGSDRCQSCAHALVHTSHSNKKHAKCKNRFASSAQSTIGLLKARTMQQH